MRNFCYIVPDKGNKICSFLLESWCASVHKGRMNTVVAKYIKDRASVPGESDKPMDVSMKPLSALFWTLSVLYAADAEPA